MKLWLISQSVNCGYDTYDSAVVAAETEEEARHTYPDNWNDGTSSYKWSGSRWMYHMADGQVLDLRPGDWAAPSEVSVEFLADGYDGPAGTVLASFNAG